MPMKFHRSFLIALMVVLGTGLTLRAQEEEATAKRVKMAPSAAKKPKTPVPAAPASKGKLKPVDINNATKEEISFMLKIDVSVAAKIVAGRPYQTKARLLTNNVVSVETYNAIKDRIVAQQPGVGAAPPKKAPGKK